VNADRNLLHLPLLTGYTLLAVFASFAFKWWNMLDWRALPAEVPLVLAVYALVTFVSNFQVRSRWMLVFPLYALFQSLVMPPLGACTYFLLAGNAATSAVTSSGTGAALSRCAPSLITCNAEST